MVPVKILLIDHASGAFEFPNSVSADESFAVTRVTNDRELKSALADCRFSLIIANLSNSQSNPGHVAKTVRESAQNSKSSLLFLLESDEGLNELVPYDAIDFLFKPVHPVALKIKLKTFKEDVDNQSDAKSPSRAAKLSIEEVIGQAQIPMCLTEGPEHRFTFANDVYRNFFLGGQDAIGIPLEEVVPQTKEQGFIRLLDEVYRTGKAYVGNETLFRFTDQTGKPKNYYFNFNYQPMRDEGLNVFGILTSIADVTEEVNARLAVERSKAAIQNERENFRRLFKQTPEMVCILTGPDHVFEFVNEAHVKVLGFDATGKAVRVAQPESVEVHGILDDVYRSGQTAHLEEIAVTVTDRLRYFNLTYAPRYNERDVVCGVMILGTETTEEVLSRKSLSLQKDALELAVNGSPLRDVFEVLCRMVETQAGGQLTASLLIADDDGKHLRHGGAPSLPTDFNKQVDGVPIRVGAGSCGTAAATRKLVIVEDVRVDPLWAEYRHLTSAFGLAACWSFPILSAHGQLLGTFAFYSSKSRGPTKREIEIAEVTARTTALIIERHLDMREREASEDRLRFALSAGAMGTWTVDLKSSGVALSNEAKQLFGIEGMAMDVDAIITSIIHPEDQTKAKQDLQKAIANRVPYRSEYRIIRPSDGDLRWILATGGARLNNAKEADIFSGIIMDITDRKKAELDLVEATLTAEKAKDEAERANELKSAFLANMSHEIRTPLGAMIGFADLLKDPGITVTERMNYADILSRNGESLSIIINDILDLSKVEAGHLTLEYRETFPQTICEEVVSLLRVKADEKNLHLDFSIDEEMAKSFVSDPTRVRQILLNIVSNAVKFTPSGSVKLRGYSCKSPRGASAACFEVSDTGIGIDESKIESVFEMFVQGDGTMTRRFGGTGLGLALSRRLARELGGDVVISRSELNVGTTFRITLEDRPAKKFAGNVLEREQIRSKVIKENALEGIRVLVVDDAPDNQHLIRRYLTKEGASVESASNGQDGYRAALHGQFDIVLMDIQMPVMDGYTATLKLRENGFTKPVIALTAHAMSEVRRKSLNVGCNDQLTKPINAKELIRTIIEHT